MTIEWFRVLGSKTGVQLTNTLIVCKECLTTSKLPLLNRVFGASQTCELCGKTDVKTKP